MKNLVCIVADSLDILNNISIHIQSDYDIYLVYSGLDAEIFDILKSLVKYAYHCKGAKQQDFIFAADKNQYREIINNYDYIFLLDEHITITPEGIITMFLYARNYNLLICQPAYRHSSLPFINHDKNALLSFSNFIYFPTALFTRIALINLIEKYISKAPPSTVKDVPAPAEKFAIIHAVVCSISYKGPLAIDVLKQEIIQIDDLYTPLVQNTIFKENRRLWLDNLLYMIEPPLSCTSQFLFDDFKLDIPPCMGRHPKMGYLESFARIFAGASPWLALNNITDAYEKSKQEIIATYVYRCFTNAIPYFDSAWNLFTYEQSIVECAYLCYGFLLSKNKLWARLPIETQQILIKIFRRVRLLIQPYHLNTNWYLFHGIIETFFKEIDVMYDKNFIRTMILTVDSWYCGDGVYSDGTRGVKMDYYNSYVIQPFYIEILKVFKSSLTTTVNKRALRYCEFLERLISHDGSFPPLGRSITYRFAAFHLLSYCIFNSSISTSHTYSALRNALTKVLINILNKDIYNTGGFLTLGFSAQQNNIADSYSNTGSCYIAATGFLVLGLPSTHEFWSCDKNSMFTQEACWAKKDFNKYLVVDDMPSIKNKIVFIIHGEKARYGNDLAAYLNDNFLPAKTVYIEEIPETDIYISKIKTELAADNIVVCYSSDISLSLSNKLKTPAIKIVNFYIGIDEDMQMITYLTYLDSVCIQKSLNAFCFKCLQPVRVLLVSPGGSACTKFLEFLSQKNITINAANSCIVGGYGLKHSKPDSLLVSAYEPTHILYQYGDLDLTVRSLFRRNLTDISYFYDEIQRFMNPLMRKKRREIKFSDFKDYIAYVIKMQKEPLGIVTHWKAWAKIKNVMFIHYKDIPTSPTIDKFLGLENGTCSEFHIKQRLSVQTPEETEIYINIIKSIDVEERILPL